MQRPLIRSTRNFCKHPPITVGKYFFNAPGKIPGEFLFGRRRVGKSAQTHPPPPRAANIIVVVLVVIKPEEKDLPENCSREWGWRRGWVFSLGTRNAATDRPTDRRIYKQISHNRACRMRQLLLPSGSAPAFTSDVSAQYRGLCYACAENKANTLHKCTGRRRERCVSPCVVIVVVGVGRESYS